MNNHRAGHLEPNYGEWDIPGGRPGLVVIAGDSCYEAEGSNPSTEYWIDIFHIFVMIVWKQTKKRPGIAHFLKSNCHSWHKQ